ncbi:hypothetical protein [Myxococcus stipitatus]|uniref:hypothetical protein n=1 Tax=Myxococcus stipitatus TaxID=83455 RepID=UPI0030CE1F86
MQPHRTQVLSQVSSLVFVALLGLVTWSTPALAHKPGMIGYGYFDYRGPPKEFEGLCKYKASRSCTCKWAHNVSFNTVDGCSNESQAMAEKEAENTCMTLCMRAERDNGGFGGGGSVLSPVGASGKGVSLEGAGTLIPGGQEGYVGFVPRTGEVVGPLTEKEKLGAWLVEQTQVPWLWYEPGKEAPRWEDPTDSAAFAQAFWSQEGSPRPLGSCGYSVQQACPLEDVKLGDSIQACASKEEEARLIAETACAPLRYNALSLKWRPLGMMGIPQGEGPRAPSAVVVAVAPNQFLGFIPSSVEPIGPSEDWGRLVEELLERTQGTTVWLAGPPSFYGPKE